MAEVGVLWVRLRADLTDFDKGMKRVSRQMNRLGRQMQDAGRTMTTMFALPLALAGGAATKFAVDFEDAFAGVRKTIDATEAQFAELSQGIRDMATKIPASATELAGLGEVAGQLGIHRTAVLGFVRTMADLAATSNLAGEEGAKSLARLANVMQTSQKHFDRLGSTITELGNNLATSESEILEFGLRLAGAGKIAKLTEAQVLAIAGAMSSVGVEAEAGGTAAQKVLIQMTRSVATGDQHLRTFAAVAGMTGEQFAAAWQENAGAAFTAFVEGLGRSGDSAFAILERLGLQDQRLIRSFLSLAGAGDLLRRSMDMGSVAWEENTALTEEAQKRYGTAASQLKILRNRVVDAGISFGEGLAPFLTAALDLMRPLIDGLRRLGDAFAKLPDPLRSAIVSVTLLLAALGPTLWAVGALSRAVPGLITTLQLLRTSTGLLSLKIAGLATVALWAVANWQTVTRWMSTAWMGLSSVVLSGTAVAVRGVASLVGALGLLVPSLRGVSQTMRGWAESLTGAAQRARQAASAAGAVGQQDQQTADSADGAAGAQHDLAEGLEAANEAANANLQSFDEVHSLQEEMAGTDLPTLGVGEMAMPEMTVPDLGGVLGLGDAVAEMGEVVASVGERIAAGWEATKARIAAAWSGLKQSALDTFPWLEGAVDTAATAANWLGEQWQKLGPVSEYLTGIITVLLIPAIVKTGIEAGIAGGKIVAAWVAQGWAALGSIAVQVKQFAIAGAKWLWLGGKALWEGGKVVLAWAVQGWAALESIRVQLKQFAIAGAKWFWLQARALWAAGRMAAAWVIGLGPVAWVIAGVVALAALIIWKWDEISAWTKKTWSEVSAWLAEKWDGIKVSAAEKWQGITDTVSEWTDSTRIRLQTRWNAITDWLGTKWDEIKTFAAEKWEGVTDSVSAMVDLARAAIVGKWESIASRLSEIWDGIKAMAGRIWSGIVDAIKSPINRAIGAINGFLDRLSSIRINIPEVDIPVVGKKGGYSVGMPNIPRIPMLKDGGNVVQPGLTLTGEEGPELLELPRGARVTPLGGGGDLADSVGRAVYAAMRDAARISSSESRAGAGDRRESAVYLDAARVGRALFPVLEREAQRRGVRLIMSPSGG